MSTTQNCTLVCDTAGEHTPALSGCEMSPASEPDFASISTLHDDLVTLTAYMAENGYTPEEMAYAVEKPWKHRDLIDTAWAETQAQLDADNAAAVCRGR